MLHPAKDRMDYGNMLMPPTGYTLSKAVCTTYSLDLNALMIMPVAMFYSQSIDRPKNEIRVDMVDAILKASEKIHVYHQDGKLHVPAKYHYLMAFWEKGLHKVRMSHYDASFHPKVWVCRFDMEGEAAIYRLIITSRNLTFANDYDIAFTGESAVGTTLQRHNQPLVDFLRYLNTIAETMNDSFIEDLLYVSFEAPNKFDNLRFHPIGVPSAKGTFYKNPLYEYHWQELLAISPFVDDTSIDRFASASNTRLKVLSVQEELSCLNPATTSSIDAWQFSKFVENAVFNEEVSENEDDPLPQSLHAKMYVATYDGQPFWYLGSANCTIPADLRNIEFLLEMRAWGKGCRPKDVVYLLTNTEEKNSVPIFEPFQPCFADDIKQEKNVQLQVRKILFYLLGSDVEAKVERQADTGLYSYVLECDLSGFHLPDGFQVYIRPLSNPQETEIQLVPGVVQKIDHLKNYTEALLTPFMAVSVYYKEEKVSEATWRIHLDLPTTRLDKIFSAIIGSRERFMEYLFFLLQGDQAPIIPENAPDGTNSDADSRGLFEGKPLLENLLIAASRDEAKLKSIKEIVSRLVKEDEHKAEEQKIVTSEFLDFWNVFDDYLLKSKTK